MKKAPKLKAKDVEFTMYATQDSMPVRGNAMSSGDAKADKRCEDEILARLDAGDVWAWAAVTVQAKWKGFIGDDSLGGCCYRDASDFMQLGGYYDDMRVEALADLNKVIEETWDDLQTLKRGSARST